MAFTSLLSLCAIATSAFAYSAPDHKHSRDHYAREFSLWSHKFNIFFSDDDEFSRRLEIFMDNDDLVQKHNALLGSSYKLAHNQFSHMTSEEFKATMLMNKMPAPDPTVPRTLLVEAKDTSTLASSIDWVEKGAVTAVKNQGQCGSCWSFSTTGALEGAYAINTGSLKSFSEQQLVSCDTTDNGCSGGLMDHAFTWIKQNGGLCSEGDYPYVSSSGTAPSCKESCTVVDGTKVKSHTDVSSTVTALKTALSQQPVSIAIEADQSAFQLYSSGVLTGTCGTKLDHGVLAVGYGTDESYGDYWKVKNSWGSTWGESGYIRIERSSDDECGVLKSASFPTL